MERFWKAYKVYCIVYIVLGIGLFGVAFYYGTSYIDNFIIATGFLVGLVPEGLFITFSVGMGSGVGKLASREIKVKNLQGIENLESANCICVDKSGLLTTSKMIIEKAFVCGKEYAIPKSKDDEDDKKEDKKDDKNEDKNEIKKDDNKEDKKEEKGDDNDKDKDKEKQKGDSKDMLKKEEDKEEKIEAKEDALFPDPEFILCAKYLALSLQSEPKEIKEKLENAPEEKEEESEEEEEEEEKRRRIRIKIKIKRLKKKKKKNLKKKRT